MMVIFVLLGSVPATSALGQALDPKKVAAERIKLLREQDRFSGVDIWYVKPKQLAGTGLLTSLYASPVYTASPSAGAAYYFRIEYSGFGWLYLGGKAIFLLDDGSRILLDQPLAKVTSKIESCSSGGGCLMTEYVRLPITQDDLRRISTAKSVEVAIYGRDNYLTGHFKPYHQAAVVQVLSVGVNK